MKNRRWIIAALLFLGLAVPLAAYLILPLRFYPGDPTDARIFYDDIQAFAKAHEIARDNNFSVDVYASHYFDRASDPVESLVRQLAISAESTAAHAREHPANYDAIVSRLAASTSLDAPMMPRVRAGTTGENSSSGPSCCPASSFTN